ncbi:MAG: sigma factor-like helix-turn-helix DNA-binding protein [Patescibacteria group bacterium]|jgi:hypothetical protein
MSGILDQVITSKHLSKLSDFDPHQTLINILTALSEREQEIIKMRHGLSGLEKKTLEDIGKQYDVTRERIRQIENTSLKKINKSFNQTILKEIEDIANATLSEHGGLMSEVNLINELLMIPGSSEENKSAIRFILNQLLNHRFYFVKESKHYNGFWKTPEANIDLFQETIDNIRNLIENHGNALSLEELISKIEEAEFYTSNDKLTDRVVINFISVSKKLKSNPYEEWGLVEWSNITPRRMNDKIYLVLKKNGAPMHFTEIADTINQMSFDHRKAYPATIHNELILDKKYVLVGRGIYALKEWGYKPGVVADVIADILRDSDKALTKKEITKAVLEKRMIKETTITLALMNKDRFSRDEKGRYSLKSE